MQRRDLLKAGALTSLIATTMHTPLRAQTINPAAGHYQFKLGTLDISVVSDGNLAIPANMLGNNQDEARVRAFLEQYYLDLEVNYAHLNHILIQDGTNTVLIDAGGGGRFMPQSSGRMIAGLKRLGISPDNITHVVLTHAHPDHIWGVRDDFDEPFAPNARYFMSAKERTFWMQDGLVDQVALTEQQFVLGAVNSINTIADVLVDVGDGHEITPNIRMINTSGHTPGHMSVIVESEGQKLLITGDALHHVIMNFVHPEWTQSADFDGAGAVASRQALFEMAASERMMVSAYHFPFPGLGHIAKIDDRYEWVPAIWAWDKVT